MFKKKDIGTNLNLHMHWPCYRDILHRKVTIFNPAQKHPMPFLKKYRLGKQKVIFCSITSYYNHPFLKRNSFKFYKTFCHFDQRNDTRLRTRFNQKNVGFWDTRYELTYSIQMDDCTNFLAEILVEKKQMLIKTIDGTFSATNAFTLAVFTFMPKINVLRKYFSM